MCARSNPEPAGIRAPAEESMPMRGMAGYRWLGHVQSAARGGEMHMGINARFA